MNKTRVMIVDDQAISRQLFEMYVKNTDNFELTFSVESAGVVDVYLLENHVDLILMDILMNDGSNGLDACAMVKRDYPEIKVIAVTSMPEQSFMDKARQCGVDSFWYKETGENEIIDVMNRTMAGEHIYPDHAPTVQLGNVLSSELTDRELDVLRIITTGASNTVVAEKLGISEHTVKTHVRSMLTKTGFANRTELAIKARALGVAIEL